MNRIFTAFSNKSNKKLSVYTFLFGCVFLLLYIFIISEGVYEGERALYRDDLTAYNIYTNPNASLWQKISDTSNNKTRYIVNIILVLFFKLVGNDFERIDTILLCWNFFISLCFFIIVLWAGTNPISNTYRRIALAFSATLIFSSSRFSYYTYSEVFGLMEGLALILTVLFSALLIKDNFKLEKKYWFANFILLIVVFVHERFFILAGTLLLYSLISALKSHSYRKPVKAVVIALVIPVFFFAIRYLALGTRVLDGTAGSSITETFSIWRFFRYCIYQIGYLLGFNAPNNAYLNGIDPRQVPITVYAVTLLSVLFIVMVFLNYIIPKSEHRGNKICKLAILWATIFFSIIASSVTIRVEMRWVYSSFAIFVFSMIYMLSALEVKTQRTRWLATQGIIVWVLCSLLVEGFYRNHWAYLYYWGDRELSSSFMEAIGPDSKEIDRLYIVSNPGELGWSEENIRALCAPYMISMNAIYFVNNIYDIESSGWVLLKEPQKNEFINISDISKNIYNVSGWYEDGWLEQEACIRIVNTSADSLDFTLNFPYEAPAGGTVKISINGEFYQEISQPDDGNTLSVKINDFPTGVVNLKLESNFYTIENSGRSENGKLSCILQAITMAK